jgi:hypothetical protein
MTVGVAKGYTFKLKMVRSHLYALIKVRIIKLVIENLEVENRHGLGWYKG